MSTADKNSKKSITYADAGVDIDAGNALVAAIKPLAKVTIRPGADVDIGGFGGLFDLKKTGFRDPILVAANDGVGTKLKIAIDTGRHSSIGIDLVAMCVNDLVVHGAEPLFFLDYFAVGKLDVQVARDVIAGIVEGCRDAGCALIGGETAEMPGIYESGDYDLAGFSVGAVERDETLPRTDVVVGDVLIGLKSSGVHSNGYGLVRKLVARAKLDWNAPAPFAHAQNQAVSEALLTPTRIYARQLLAVIRTTGGSGSKGAIKALSHITGGGLSGNVPRVMPKDAAARIDLSSFEAPSVFEWMAKTGDITDAELLRTFNCGVGMVAVVSEACVDDVLAELRAAGEDPIVIGDVMPPTGEKSEAKGKSESWAVKYNGKLRFA